ncbi:hypothetical protein [Streptosporangium sp. NPDC002524]|uniref:DUF7927 domain-containing protein n=1 Tax=Streptosporangium sp. NPDC002524 TaxID=3154537 RepID=UPI00332BA404
MREKRGTSVVGRRGARGGFGGESRATARGGEPEVREPRVRITKTAWPVLAKPGQRITYTVRLRNTGDTRRSDFTFTDDLSGLLDDARFDHDQSATSGTVSFAAPEVTWTGDVAAGQTVTVTYGVTVDDPPAGDLRLSGELVGPEGSNCAAGSIDPACGNLGAPGLPLLYVLMTADRESAVPGQVVTYTITVSNVGNAAYRGATLTGELSRVIDDATYNGDARVTSGTLSYGAPKLAWTGDIPVAEIVTITYSVTVGTPGAGDGALDSAVQAPGGGTNCPDPVPWSARFAAPVPGAGLGCAQRVAVERTTDTGTPTSGTSKGSEASEGPEGPRGPEVSGPGDGAADVKAGDGCPAGAGGPGCGRRPVETASAPAAPDASAPASADGSAPASAPASVPASAPASAPAPAPASADGSASTPDPGSAPIPAPGSVPSPSPGPVPGSGPASVSGSPSSPSGTSGTAPVPGSERTPVPARVPERPVDPSCVPGRGRSFSIPCPAGWSRVEPAGPTLPFTGLPFWPVLVGLVLSGLGLALRLSARRGRF